MEKIKHCRHCDVELVVGENITPSMFKNSDFQCKSCNKIKHAKYWKENKKAQYANNVSWNKKNKERRKELLRRNHESIPAGVYAIKEFDTIIYIGHSRTPYKRIYSNHFSKSQGNNSVISPAIELGELKRKNLSFTMLAYEDDKQRRLEIEREYITKYKPKYNS